MEDIKKKDVVQAEEGTAAGTDTENCVYVHKFGKPYKFQGRTYTEMTFNFEKLIGSDLVNIENEMAGLGEYALSPEISTSFLYRLAARAAGVGSDVIANMPVGEFGKIKNKSRDFLISTGF